MGRWDRPACMVAFGDGDRGSSCDGADFLIRLSIFGVPTTLLELGIYACAGVWGMRHLPTKHWRPLFSMFRGMFSGVRVPLGLWLSWTVFRALCSRPPDEFWHSEGMVCGSTPTFIDGCGLAFRGAVDVRSDHSFPWDWRGCGGWFLDWWIFGRKLEKLKFPDGSIAFMNPQIMFRCI